MAVNPTSLQNLRPFKEGVDERRKLSGRKPTRLLTDLLEKTLKSKKEMIIEGLDINTNLPVKIRVETPNKDDVIKALLKEAAKGNTNAIKEVWDRLEGKALQAVELTGENGGPIQHQVITGMTIL